MAYKIKKAPIPYISRHIDKVIKPLEVAYTKGRLPLVHLQVAINYIYDIDMETIRVTNLRGERVRPYLRDLFRLFGGTDRHSFRQYLLNEYYSNKHMYKAVKAPLEVIDSINSAKRMKEANSDNE